MRNNHLNGDSYDRSRAIRWLHRNTVGSSKRVFVLSFKTVSCLLTVPECLPFRKIQQECVKGSKDLGQFSKRRLFKVYIPMCRTEPNWFVSVRSIGRIQGKRYLTIARDHLRPHNGFVICLKAHLINIPLNALICFVGACQRKELYW